MENYVVTMRRIDKAISKKYATLSPSGCNMKLEVNSRVVLEKDEVDTDIIKMLGLPNEANERKE